MDALLNRAFPQDRGTNRENISLRLMMHDDIKQAPSPIAQPRFIFIMSSVLWRFQALDSNLSAWRIPSDTLASLGNCLTAQSASLPL